MSNRYWVADLHLGHVKVSGLRGFETTEEHDEEVMKPLLRLTKHDTVWCLGDISGGQTEEYALERLKDVKAEIHLIAGNHDSVSSIHKSGYKRQRKWLETFTSIQQFGRVTLNKQKVLMSHYPYARSRDGDNRDTVRYLAYRLPDIGLPLIHGHTHQDSLHMTLPNGVLDTQQLCVSWDSRRGLTTEKHIVEWLKEFNAKL